MAGSLVVAVRSAVTTGLTTLYAGLADFNGTTDASQNVEVSYGYFPTSDAGERVFTNRGRGDTPPAAMRSGRNYRNETATFELVVLVAMPGGSPEDAETRALEIGLKAEEWLADRKSNELGVTGLNTLVVESWELAGLGNDHGNIAELTYQIRYTARLT